MKTLEELGVSPAPWTAETGPMVSMVYDGKPGLCSVCAASGDNRKADTALIAAAPDLYAALRMCLAFVDDDMADEDPRLFAVKTRDAVHAAYAALAKAGGAE